MGLDQFRTVVVAGLSQYYSRADETQKIIINCALTAAVADAFTGSIPIISIPATIISCFGAVWVMYGILCDTLGITLKKNVLKLLARAALSNIAANLGGAMLTLLVGMFVPVGATISSAIISFVTVYIAGVVFLKTILNLAQKSSDPYSFSDISSREMKSEIKDVNVSEEDLETAKKIYEENKSNEQNQ